MAESTKHIQDLARFFFNDELPQSLLTAQNLVGKKRLRSAVADCVMLLNYIFNLNKKNHCIILENNESSKALRVLINECETFNAIFDVNNNKIVLKHSLLDEDLSDIRKVVNNEIQIKVLQQLTLNESKVSGEFVSAIMRIVEKILP